MGTLDSDAAGYELLGDLKEGSPRRYRERVWLEGLHSSTAHSYFSEGGGNHVLERLTARGPPPPLDPVFVGKNEKKLIGPCVVHKLLGSGAPPPVSLPIHMDGFCC